MSATSPKTFLVCHGAWSAGWAWKKMHPLMQAAGHRLVTPTYTGPRRARASGATRRIDLDTHIEDMLNVIKYEDLRDIVLVGHSYGGMVATGVADRARDKVKQLIYIDAFVPAGRPVAARSERGGAAAHAGTCEDPAAGACRRTRRRRIPRRPTSNGSQRAASTCRSNVSRPNSSCRAAPLTLPRSYIYATRITPADTFGPFARMTKDDAAWSYYEIDASHSPNVTAPEALMALLQKIAA